MSTQPDAGNDLDRTDELPQLDVAAYEAGLAEGEADADPLSRTDTWAVQALQEMVPASDDDDDEEAASGALRHDKQVIAGGADLSVGVDRLLKRIAELEAGLVTAHASNAEVEGRCQSLMSERAAVEQRLAAVEADNARLGEHREISQELAQRLERQLREQAEQHRVQLAEIEAAREADRHAAQQDRAALERQIEQNAASFSSKADQHAKLKLALEESIALSEARAQRIDELQKTLAQEEGAAYGLGRNLAAKLVDYDILSSMVAQRNATIVALEHERDDLGRQLQESAAKAKTEIDRLHQELHASAAQHDELTATRDTVTAKDAELAHLATQLTSAQNDSAAIWAELETQSNLVHALQEELASAHQLTATLQETREELQQSIDQARKETLQAEAELQEAAEQLDARNAELDAVRHELSQHVTSMRSLEQALHARDTLIESVRAEMRTAQEERAIMANQLNNARVRMKAMAQQIFTADNRIATLKADLAVHTEALAAIRRDVEHVDDHPDALAAERTQRVLEPLNHEGEIVVLNRKVMTIGRTNENDIFIPSKLISRHHARLMIGPNAVIVEDAGSTNGCYVNGHQVKQHVLHENDVLSLGDLKFRLRVRPLPETQTRARSNVIDFNKPS